MSRLRQSVLRLAAEILEGGEAEMVGFKTLRGYHPTYMEVDGIPIALPAPDRPETTGVRVRRRNGEIALYLTPTMERAQSLLADAQRFAAGNGP